MAIKLLKGSKWTVVHDINGVICEAKCACGAIEHPQIWDLENDSLMCDSCRAKLSRANPRVSRREVTDEVLVGTEWSLVQAHTYKDAYGNWYSKLKCSCGEEHNVSNKNILSGRSKRCVHCAAKAHKK